MNALVMFHIYVRIITNSYATATMCSSSTCVVLTRGLGIEVIFDVT